MRTLQAQLVAEKVCRDLAEQRAGEREGRMVKLQAEYQSALRALKRARSEGQRTEAERAAYARTYELAKDRWVGGVR